MIAAFTAALATGAVVFDIFWIAMTKRLPDQRSR